MFGLKKCRMNDALQVLSTALDRTMARPDDQEKLLQMGIEPVTRTRDELKAFAESEKDKWGRLIRASGLKPAS